MDMVDLLLKKVPVPIAICLKGSDPIRYDSSRAQGMLPAINEVWFPDCQASWKVLYNCRRMSFRSADLDLQQSLEALVRSVVE